MKHILLIISIVLFSSAMAQTQPQTPIDPLDPTPYLIQIERDGVPTPTTVQKLKEVAIALFDAGKFKEAIPALDAHRKAANWLANLIASGNKPFYSATASEQRNISYNVINSLAPYEKQSNDLKNDRNHSTVMLAECYVKTNDKSRAIATYLSVLNIIEVDDWEWWNRARLGLYALLEVK